MHAGHARFSFEPLPVTESPPNSTPVPEPLSPLSDLSPSPPLTSAVQGARTRLASGSVNRPSQRRRDAAEHSAPPPTPMQSVRRIRPLACTSANMNVNTASPVVNSQSAAAEKAWKADAWRTSAGDTQPQAIIDFPPKHVVLHPDDVNNKVFLAIGRALMSVNNCAMTIKDLAELSMRHGMVCQNVSAASQAITFFIRSHLNRCEEEQDFPLLLRHVLSGTQRDDALAPALYSRTGGNVTNKDKTARDENGNLKERITCFRRGTTVWYLSRAAGAPCPFARVGIALRDYAEASAISSVEGRRIDGDLSKGIKRKRERNLRRRAGSGPAARRDDEEGSSEEEKRPQKIKLTLRLRPCLTTMREKTEVEEDDTQDSSDSDSDSDAQDEPMQVDALVAPASGTSGPSARKSEPTWTFPPFPIQRRISIPPYTPCEETYPSIYTSPTYASSYSEWPAITKPKLELACVDSPPRQSSSGQGSSTQRERAPSVSYSVASPPPDSDDEFGFDDDGDDDASFSMSPEIRFKREEDDFRYVWPEAAPSTSSIDLARVKTEPDIDDEIGTGPSKRSSTQTVKQIKLEDVELDISSLTLAAGESPTLEAPSFELDRIIKQEEDDFAYLNEGFSWGQPVDLTHDDVFGPDCDATSRVIVGDDVLWRNVELLGPDTVDLQDLEDGGWDEEFSRHDCDGSSGTNRHAHHEQADSYGHNAGTRQSPEHSVSVPTSQIPNSPALTLESLSPPPSLAGSVHAWSVCSPDTEIDSVGPASPPSFAGPESPSVLRSDDPPLILQTNNSDIGRSSPWTIPGRQVGSTVPSRQAIAVRSEDIPNIPLSERPPLWERGMCTEEDVEEHLLEPARSLEMLAIKHSARAAPSIEGALSAPEPPLSPQEEAVFQSLCTFPDMSWEDEPDVKQTDDSDAPEAIASRSSDANFVDVLAAARRPAMRLRERRQSKRLTTELEQARKQTTEVPSPPDNAVEESDTDSESEDDLPTPRRERNTASKSSSKDSSNAGKGPLRRSKRVANAVATQRNRERLRRRTAT
ncbi:uncharacterized protein FOMMEDRAFT_18205 [Fomitiporia mediterranea MF3/22]|uniref:uncharacterized protein n=1 Tax=Fomitiporia mediterranea (strain MF3/22) TaxID=694068 RepID=UPI0004409285|nr:uncharacterized protein FOMMEDRAFT_18205 [Fomitiporia mediterranea MF3/22]EJD05986.1 hypothetical protein FOMMEDRAFT_18205 [Fomitiporia mediterranea MF3/22]